MRRLLSSLAAVSLLTVQQAQAEMECLPPQERAAVQVAALRSELMVLATGCHDDDGYNTFIRKFQAELLSNEKTIGAIFQHKYGRRGQQQHDQFTTDLANAEFELRHASRHRLLRPQWDDHPGSAGAAQRQRAGKLCGWQGSCAGVTRRMQRDGITATRRASQGRGASQAPLS